MRLPLTPIRSICGLAALAVALALAGCGARPNPVTRPAPGIAAPVNLTGQVGGNGAVLLSWNPAGDVSLIVRYRVYRAVGTKADARFALIDSTVAPPNSTTETVVSMVVQGLTVGQTYQLTVAAVGFTGIEGERAPAIITTAARYSIQLSDCTTGLTSLTKSPLVCVRLFAPRTTQSVELADEPTFSTDVEQFEFPASNPPVIQHRFVDSDPSHQGNRIVYARFTSDTGVQSAIVSSQIRYDAFAALDSVVVSPRSHVFVTGEVVHLAAYTTQRETGGSVVFSLSNPGKTVTIPRTANDNGTNGDRVAADGVYEVDYTVTGQTLNEITDAVPLAVFTDAAGNVSSELRGSQSVTINVPPPAVRMNTPVPFSNGASISYTPTNVSDWASYETYYSTDSLALAGAECSTCPAPPPSPCTSICHWDSWTTDQSRSSFTITGLNACQKYFFRIFVHDTGGLSTGSTIVSATTSCASSFVPPPAAGPPRLPGARTAGR